MAQPTARNVRPVDPVLTNLSIGFRNPEFIWDQAMPPITVDQKTGTFFIWTRDFWMRRQAGGVRAPSGPYLRVGYGVTTGTYIAIERGFEKATDDPTKAASQAPESLDVVDTEFLTNLMQLEMEKDVAGEFFAAAKWQTDTTLVTTNQWSDFDNSDPINDAEVAKRTIRRDTGASPNLLVVGALGWEKLKEHPLLLEKYKHTQSGILTAELVAAALGVSTLLVGSSVENTAAEGATYVGADIWADNAVFVSIPPNPGLMVPAGGYNFIWDERGNVPWAVENYRDETIRANVTRIFTHYVPKITAKEFGYRYADVVA